MNNENTLPPSLDDLRRLEFLAESCAAIAVNKWIVQLRTTTPEERWFTVYHSATPSGTPRDVPISKLAALREAIDMAMEARK